MRSVSWGCARWATQKFCHSVNDPEMSENDPESTMNIDFGVTNTYQPVGEFTDTESANNEDLL